MNRICVRIDREKLRERLSRERGVSLTAFQVVQWLHRAGFILEGVWQCDHEDALQKLKPEEILEFVRTQTEHGVTFIEHEKPDRGL
ncbi:MAG TPA: hypothetical protein VLJ39_07240 [Tepidisphaeraceae bacterium]|nr:hypothetical protein [Tepidisphaeraceae bacterium]